MKDLGMIPTRGVCLPYGVLSSVAGTWAKHAHGSMWQRSNSRRPYDRGTGSDTHPWFLFSSMIHTLWQVYDMDLMGSN
jgi:hypothetical protein